MDQKTPGGAADPKASANDPASLVQAQETGRAEEAHLADEAAAAMGEAAATIRRLQADRTTLMANTATGATARTERMSRMRSALDDLRKALKGSAVSLLLYAAVFAGALAAAGVAANFTARLAA